MLVVETVAEIRRAHFVQEKPIKQICLELKLSRKVVRKVLRSEETAFDYRGSSNSVVSTSLNSRIRRSFI